MSKPIVWIPLGAALLTTFAASPLASAQEGTRALQVFSLNAPTAGLEVLWSGRLQDGAAARVERVDATHISVVIGELTRTLALSGTRPGVCVDDAGHSWLMLTGKEGDVGRALRITSELVETFTLPAHAASAPHALLSDGACTFGIALVDGTLLQVEANGHLAQSPVLFERVADLTEIGRGIPLVGVGGDVPTFVVSRAGRTSAWRPSDNTTETVDLDALDPMIASAHSAWSVDRAGALHVYTPFVGTRQMAPSQGAVTSGLLATTLDQHDVLAWATTEGGVFTWDGSVVQSRAQWSAAIRAPLLAVDITGDATMGLLALLEDGSAAVIRGDLAQPIELGARSARAPMLVMVDSNAPSCLSMSSASGSLCFALNELGPMGPLGEGVSPMPGEVIALGQSRPQQTHFEPIWGSFEAPLSAAPGPATQAAPTPPPLPAPASPGFGCSTSGRAMGGAGWWLAMLGWVAMRRRPR